MINKKESAFHKEIKKFLLNFHNNFLRQFHYYFHKMYIFIFTSKWINSSDKIQLIKQIILNIFLKDWIIFKFEGLLVICNFSFVNLKTELYLFFPIFKYILNNIGFTISSFFY